MRKITDFDEANIVAGQFDRWKSLKSTRDNDLNGIRMSNASPARDDFDYTTLSQINPVIIFKLGTPVIGMNITNRVTCKAQPGVRLMNWHLVANTGPLTSASTFDVRLLKINEALTEADLLIKGTSIFPPGVANKMIHPVGAIRAKGAKFQHTPFDFMYEEELVFDVISCSTSPGTQVHITFNTQLLGLR